MRRFLAITSLLFSCAPGGSSSTTGGSGCVEGQQIECACGNGITGTQVCTADGKFGMCICASGGSSSSGTQQQGSSSGPAQQGSSSGPAQQGSSAVVQSSSTPAQESHAPVVESITFSEPVMNLAQGTFGGNGGTTILVRVLVSDVDGVGNLASADLRDTVSNGSLGMMNIPVAGAGNSVELEGRVNSSELNALSTIQFTGDAYVRELEAVIRDDDGHETRQRFSLPIDCPGDWGACNGLCYDLMTDWNNCGACGRAIPSDQTSYYGCRNGERIGVFAADPPSSCDTYCATRSGVCHPNPPGAVYERFNYLNLVQYSDATDHICMSASLNDEGARLITCSETPPTSLSCASGAGHIYEQDCICMLQ